MLLKLKEAELPSPEPFGFVEITPEREYLIVTEFLDGAAEMGDAEVDEGVIDDALLVMRKMWDSGLAHRDIKPANVMVTDEGRIVIADFGVAHVTHEDSVVTRTGAILGTPAYMSPEQAGADELDARSDLYSVGATLYRLASGQMPFTGSPAKVVTAIVTGNFTPPLRRAPEMGPDLAKVISRLMATKRDDRYASAADAAEALREVTRASRVSEEDATAAAVSGEVEALRAAVLAATLDRADEARERGRIPSAIALADRALALDPDNASALTLIDKISAERSRGWMRWVAGGVAAAAIAAIAGISLGVHEREVTTEGLGPPIVVAGPQPEIADAGAPAIVIDTGAVAVVDPDAAPKKIDHRTNVLRPPTPVADAGAVALAPAKPDAAVAIVAPPTAPLTGTLELKFVGKCDLAVDGKGRGELFKKKRIELPIGKVLVTCKNTTTGMNKSRSVMVRADKTTPVTFVHHVTITVGGDVDGIKIGGKYHPKGSRVRVKAGRLKYFAVRKSEEAVQYASITRDCTLNAISKACR